MYFVIDTYSKFGIKHIVYLVLLVVYSFIGALIFISIEGPKDRERLKVNHEVEIRKYRQSLFFQKKLENIIQNLKGSNNRSAADNEDEQAISWCKKESDHPEPKRNETPWTLFGGLFYASSIYTTVGYGKIVCVTKLGRIMTMCYALLGIPLVITILGNFGNLLFRVTCFTWNKITRIRQKICKGRDIGKRCCMPTQIQNLTDEHDYLNMETVPLSFAFFIAMSYICIAAGIFCTFENWSFFVSFYYFFISLTTIGFGDVTPSKINYAVMCGVLLFIGLCVVSMCLNVIQAKIDFMFKEVMAAIDNQYKQSLVSESRIGGKEGWAILRQRHSLMQRVLIKMMGTERKKQIEQKWEAKAKLVNRGMQTEAMAEEVGVQTYVRGKSAVFTQTMARNCFPCKGGSMERIYLNFNHIHNENAEHNHIHEHHH